MPILKPCPLPVHAGPEAAVARRQKMPRLVVAAAVALAAAVVLAEAAAAAKAAAVALVEAAVVVTAAAVALVEAAVAVTAAAAAMPVARLGNEVGSVVVKDPADRAWSKS